MQIEVHTGSARVPEVNIAFYANDTEEEKAVIAALANLPHIDIEGVQLHPVREEMNEISIEFHELSYEEIRRRWYGNG